MDTLLAVMKEAGCAYVPQPEELKLIRRSQNGHQVATDKLCQTLYWSIIGVTARLVGDRTPEDQFDELLSAGIVGAMKAIGSYSFDSRARLRTFAMPHIRGEIMREMSKGFSHLSVPHNAVTEARKLANGVSSTELRISDIKAESLRHAIQPAGDFDLALELSDSGTNVAGDTAFKESVLSVLSPTQYFVVCFSYGVFGFAKLRRPEIAAKLGIPVAEVTRALDEGVDTLQAQIQLE